MSGFNYRRSSSDVEYITCVLSDRILLYVQQNGAKETKVIFDHLMPISIEYDYRAFCHLCELMQEDGVVSLQEYSDRGSGGFNEYIVRLTNRGASFLQFNRGYKARLDEKKMLIREERRKSKWLRINSIAVILVAVLPLGYQIWRDNNEKKKVVKLVLQKSEVEKLKVILQEPAKVVLHIDSSAVKAKKLPMR